MTSLKNIVAGIAGNFLTVSFDEESGKMNQGEFINAWDWDPGTMEENEEISGFVTRDGVVYREIGGEPVFFEGEQTQTGYFPGFGEWLEYVHPGM